MSQTGTPTEFLKLGITEPDDTLNVLVDLNGQWQKIDTGVKNVDTKANTNASGISALNTAVQDNTENITNILETNVNQQTSIDTLQSKVATLEQDDTSYGTRITAVEAGVQENSELINDLEVDLSGVKTSVGTVPEGSNLQGEVNGLDTRVTALENSGSVAAVEARVTTLETEVGTVPAGETVQGQITTLNGQVKSGNIPFRFSVDGEGNYGYLKADDSFVPFRSGSGGNLYKLDTTLYYGTLTSLIVSYKGNIQPSSPYYKKVHNLVTGDDYTLPSIGSGASIYGNIALTNTGFYLLSSSGVESINIEGFIFDASTRTTHYLTRNNLTFQYKVVDINGNVVGVPATCTLRGTPTSPICFHKGYLVYQYNSQIYKVEFDTQTGTSNESTWKTGFYAYNKIDTHDGHSTVSSLFYYQSDGTLSNIPDNNTVIFNTTNSGYYMINVGSDYYYYN